MEYTYPIFRIIQHSLYMEGGFSIMKIIEKGNDLLGFAKKVTLLAKNLGATVDVEFNDVELTVQTNSTVRDVVQQYQNGGNVKVDEALQADLAEIAYQAQLQFEAKEAQENARIQKALKLLEAQEAQEALSAQKARQEEQARLKVEQELKSLEARLEAATATKALKIQEVQEAEEAEAQAAIEYLEFAASQKADDFVSVIQKQLQDSMNTQGIPVHAFTDGTAVVVQIPNNVPEELIPAIVAAIEQQESAPTVHPFGNGQELDFEEALALGAILRSLDSTNINLPDVSLSACACGMHGIEEDALPDEFYQGEPVPTLVSAAGFINVDDKEVGLDLMKFYQSLMAEVSVGKLSMHEAYSIFRERIENTAGATMSVTETRI